MTYLLSRHLPAELCHRGGWGLVDGAPSCSHQIRVPSASPAEYGPCSHSSSPAYTVWCRSGNLGDTSSTFIFHLKRWFLVRNQVWKKGCTVNLSLQRFSFAADQLAGKGKNQKTLGNYSGSTQLQGKMWCLSTVTKLDLRSTDENAFGVWPIICSWVLICVFVLFFYYNL